MIKKMICCFFVFILSFCIACSKNDKSQTDTGGKGGDDVPVSAGGSSDEDGVPVPADEIKINSYESTKDLDTVLISGVLGTVTINNDGKFIKSGKGSAKITVIHDPYMTGNPLFYQSFYQQDSELDYIDFENINLVTLYIYNAQNAKRKVSVQLTYGGKTSEFLYYNLEPQKWTEIRYPVEREYIPLKADLNDTGGKKGARAVKGLNISFFRDGEADNVFYVDDIVLHKTTASYQPYEMELEENEICSFDKDWQVKTVRTSGSDSNHNLRAPTVISEDEIVFGGKGKSMKVTAYAGSYNHLQEPENNQRYPGIALNPDMLKLVDFANYPPEARLCFDIYNPAENGIDVIFLGLYAVYNEVMDTHGDKFFNSWEINLPKGKWSEISYSVKNINASKTANQSKNFFKTAYIQITYGEFTGSDKVFYVDNFRMEYEPPREWIDPDDAWNLRALN